MAASVVNPVFCFVFRPHCGELAFCPEFFLEFSLDHIFTTIQNNSQIYNWEPSKRKVTAMRTADGDEWEKCGEITEGMAKWLEWIIKGQRSISLSFLESDDVSVLSEAFSAEQEIVFADETHLAGAGSALTAVLSIFSRVSSPEQVWHCVANIIKLIFN